MPSPFRVKKGNFMLSGSKNALRHNHFKTNKHTLLICIHLTTLDVNHHWNRYPSPQASKSPKPTRPWLRNECTCQGKHLRAFLPKHLLLSSRHLHQANAREYRVLPGFYLKWNFILTLNKIHRTHVGLYLGGRGSSKLSVT